MTNSNDRESDSNQDPNSGDEPNLASKRVSEVYESWVDEKKRRPVRLDVLASWHFSTGNHLSFDPIDEAKAFFDDFEKLTEKVGDRDNFNSTEHWTKEMDRFTSAMVTEVYKVREEIFQKTADNNAAKLLLSEILIESAEAGDPVEPLALTYGDAKKCSEFFHNMITQSKVDFNKSMSSQSRDTTKAAGVYRFIKPKRK